MYEYPYDLRWCSIAAGHDETPVGVLDLLEQIPWGHICGPVASRQAGRAKIGVWTDSLEGGALRCSGALPGVMSGTTGLSSEARRSIVVYIIAVLHVRV